jgi:8-oxo-dGTP pyrophosphatase MutT (NUDIX family)
MTGGMESYFDLNEVEITNRLQAAYHLEIDWDADGFAEITTRGGGIQLKCAAVLLPLIRKEQEWHLIFTHRTDNVDSHKGQVSFPGGGCELTETMPEQTALREAHEEIGLMPQDAHLLGRLNDIVTITQFRISPVVCTIPFPYEFHLSWHEVSRVFSIPLRWMAHPDNWKEYNFTPDGTQRSFPVITYQPYEGELLWGASARIVHNFLEVMGLVQRQERLKDR